MATENKNLSQYNKAELPNVAGSKFAIITSEWNNHITFNLRDGAKDTLIDLGASPEDVTLYQVPGSFELIYGADKVAQTHPDLDGIIVVGCVIRGATAHFDYVCQGVTQGIKELNIKHDMPIIFCVLTDENEQQSIDRSGGKHGNKGIEAGVAAVMMADMKKKLFS
ncbi:6,7-dimethyl-8-ribityllumazine synthase [Empedobacter brevis]|uniref:6,7-dimethyl-8-ribityllumazine synthase n=1 Tax=Empedobacter brevis TaxID=247 RepID=A0AAJ1QF38_9FLAO|nr:6,7-dimethyl-8-ribityllumazine synthase [Empedobacter brevis]MDM1072918.1 6,7-dimethyl-8-ribityllumazine synthase [Empedobacter brevis]QES91763.1 6,7-dimethyl-8-ribityllumazine synthase [Empedobacter brevis]